MSYKFTHDAEYQALSKLPRKGMWNRNFGRVLFRCPQCGGVNDFSNHKVEDGDFLQPSVVCSHNGCTFHEHPVQADGITDPEKGGTA